MPRDFFDRDGQPRERRNRGGPDDEAHARCASCARVDEDERGESDDRERHDDEIGREVLLRRVRRDEGCDRQQCDVAVDQRPHEHRGAQRRVHRHVRAHRRAEHRRPRGPQQRLHEQSRAEQHAHAGAPVNHPERGQDERGIDRRRAEQRPASLTEQPNRHGEQVELDRPGVVGDDPPAVFGRRRRQTGERGVPAEDVEHACGDVRVVAARHPAVVIRAHERHDEGDEHRDQQRAGERPVTAVEVAQPVRRRIDRAGAGSRRVHDPPGEPAAGVSRRGGRLRARAVWHSVRNGRPAPGCDSVQSEFAHRSPGCGWIGGGRLVEPVPGVWQGMTMSDFTQRTPAGAVDPASLELEQWRRFVHLLLLLVQSGRLDPADGMALVEALGQPPDVARGRERAVRDRAPARPRHAGREPARSA